MPTLGLENRQAAEALDEDRRANKRVFKNEQKQVAVSNRTVLPPSQIERRTVYEIDIAVGEINNILQTRIQAIQAPLQAQIPNIDPNAPPPPPVAPGPVDVDLTPIIPIWNRLVSIIDVYGKGIDATATSADFKFITQKLKQIEPNLQLLLTLIENFGGRAPAGVIGNVSGLRQAREIATQVQNGIIYTKINDVGPVVQNQPQLQQQIANAQNQLAAAQAAQMGLPAPQQGQPPAGPQGQQQPPQPLPPQAIANRQLQAIKNAVAQEVFQALPNPNDRPTLRVLQTLLMPAVRDMYLSGQNPPFQIQNPLLDAVGQLDLQQFAQLYTQQQQASRDFQRFMRSIQANPGVYVNALFNGFGLGQVPGAPPQGAPPPYATVIQGDVNDPNLPEATRALQAIQDTILLQEQGTGRYLVNDQDIGAVEANITQQPWIARLMNVFGNDPNVLRQSILMVMGAIRQQREQYAQQYGVQPQVLSGQGMGSGFFDDLKGFTSDVGKAVGAEPFSWNPITNIKRSIAHSLPVQLGKLALDVAGRLKSGKSITGGRNDRANSGSLFLSNRGNPDRNNTYVGGRTAHPLSRLLGGVGSDDDDFQELIPPLVPIGAIPSEPDWSIKDKAKNLTRRLAIAVKDKAIDMAQIAKSGITSLPALAIWLVRNATTYAQAVLTNPTVQKLAKDAGVSVVDFVSANPTVALIYVLPPPFNTAAIASAIVYYLGRNWWREYRGGVMPLHTRTEPAIHRQDMTGGVNGKRGPQSYRVAYEGPIEPFDVFTGMNTNLTASDMTAGLAKYMATQVPDAGLSNPYYRTPSHDQNVYMIGGNQACEKILQQPITMEYDPQPDGSQNRMAAELKRRYRECIANSKKTETTPMNVGLPNFLRDPLDTDGHTLFLNNRKLKGSAQPLFGLPLNVDSGRVMEQNAGKHFRSLPIKDGKYLHRNKPYINAELFNDADNEMYRGMEMERPNYGTSIMEETPKHKALIEEMRAEDGFFAKKHAKKLGLKKDVKYFMK